MRALLLILLACSGTPLSMPWKPAAELHAAFSACGDARLKAKIDGSLHILGDALRIFGSDAVYRAARGTRARPLDIGRGGNPTSAKN